MLEFANTLSLLPNNAQLNVQLMLNVLNMLLITTSMLTVKLQLVTKLLDLVLLRMTLKPTALNATNLVFHNLLVNQQPAIGPELNILALVNQNLVMMERNAQKTSVTPKPDNVNTSTIALPLIVLVISTVLLGDKQTTSLLNV